MTPDTPNTDDGDSNCQVVKKFSPTPGLTRCHEYAEFSAAFLDLVHKHDIPCLHNSGLHLAGSKEWTSIPVSERPHTMLLVIELKEEDRKRWVDVDGDTRQLLRDHGLEDQCYARYYLYTEPRSETLECLVHTIDGIPHLSSDDDYFGYFATPSSYSPQSPSLSDRDSELEDRSPPPPQREFYSAPALHSIGPQGSRPRSPSQSTMQSSSQSSSDGCNEPVYTPQSRWQLPELAHFSDADDELSDTSDVHTTHPSAGARIWPN